jgi:hypothetical protein
MSSASRHACLAALTNIKGCCLPYRRGEEPTGGNSTRCPLNSRTKPIKQYEWDGQALRTSRGLGIHGTHILHRFDTRCNCLLPCLGQWGWSYLIIVNNACYITRPADVGGCSDDLFTYYSKSFPSNRLSILVEDTNRRCHPSKLSAAFNEFRWPARVASNGFFVILRHSRNPQHQILITL